MNINSRDIEHGVRFESPSGRRSTEEVRREFGAGSRESRRDDSYVETMPQQTLPSSPVVVPPTPTTSRNHPPLHRSHTEPTSVPQNDSPRGILREPALRSEHAGSTGGENKNVEGQTRRRESMRLTTEADDERLDTKTAGTANVVAPDGEKRPKGRSASTTYVSSNPGHPSSIEWSGWVKIPFSPTRKEAVTRLGYPFQDMGNELFVPEGCVPMVEAYSTALDHVADERARPPRYPPPPPPPPPIISPPRYPRPQPPPPPIISPPPNHEEPRYREHSTTYLRPQYTVPYSDDDDEPEDSSFRLSRYKKFLLNRDSSIYSASTTISEKDFATQPSTNILQVGKVLRVLQSRYTGDGTFGGDQSVELKFADDSGTETRQTQSIFKWLQIEDKSMNLDRFETAATTLAGLTDSQKSGITRIFKRIRKDYDKRIQTPNGSNARFMAPTIASTQIGPELRVQKEKSLGQRSVIWMCLPYFLLQKYSATSKNLTDSHPLRTLLQTHSSFTQKKRDMQQAVCKLPGWKKLGQDYCFHIAQVWCLVVDESFLVTCSHNPIPSLMGNLISISSEPSSPNVSKTRHHSRTRFPAPLLVCNGNSLWSIPLDECQTWFAFLLHFWEFIPRRLQFLYGRNIITADSWPTVMKLASKGIVRISMVEIKSEIQEPGGILIYRPPPSSNGVPPQVPKGVFLEKVDTETARSKKPASHIDPQNTMDDNVDNEGVEKKAKSVQPNPPDDDLNHNFHVFTWLNEVNPKSWNMPNQLSDSTPDDFTMDDKNLQSDLREVDRYLTSQAVFEDRTAYLACDQRSRHEIYELLANEKEEVAVVNEKDIEKSKIYEDKVAVVNRAETGFRFFLPSQFEGRSVSKFWGALNSILISLTPNSTTGRVLRSRDPREFLQWLGQIIRIIQYFTEVFSQANTTERSEIELPEEFARAWIHYLLTIVYWSGDSSWSAFDKHSSLCCRLLNEGIGHLLLDMPQKSLLKYSVFKPLDLASMTNLALLGDTTERALDIRDIYFDYLTYLELAIDSNPLDRSHQDKLKAFLQEVSVIERTLEQQRQIILGLSQRISSVALPEERPKSTHYSRSGSRPIGRKTSYSSRGISHSASYADPRDTFLSSYDYPSASSARPSGAYKAVAPSLTSGVQVDPTDPACINSLLMQGSNVLLDHKIDQFEQMRRRACELEDLNIDEIKHNKDRQDGAIFIFTIITVIFLPLSTVAGILGMNTNDVRNMETNQWVFWVTAIPLTILVITLSLMWTGDLGNVRGWLIYFWSNKKRRRVERDRSDTSSSSRELIDD